MTPWQGRTTGHGGGSGSAIPISTRALLPMGTMFHYGSIRLAHKLKQDKLLLVTDATPPAGTSMDAFHHWWAESVLSGWQMRVYRRHPGGLGPDHG